MRNYSRSEYFIPLTELDECLLFLLIPFVSTCIPSLQRTVNVSRSIYDFVWLLFLRNI
jgi:hypothetical protein